MERKYGTHFKRALIERIIDFIDENFQDDTSLKAFDKYMQDYLKKNGYQSLGEYVLDVQAKRREQSNSQFLTERDYQKLLSMEQNTPISSVLTRKVGPSSGEKHQPNKNEWIEKLAALHKQLIRERNRLIQLAPHHPLRKELNERIHQFNQLTQKAFQQQYPELRLRPFSLQSSEVAIHIMKHRDQNTT